MIAGCNAKEQIPLAYSHWKASLDYTVTVDNRWLDPGYTGVMAVKHQPSGATEATFAAVPTALVPNCVPDTIIHAMPAPSS